MLSSLILAAALQLAGDAPAAQTVDIDRNTLNSPAGAAAAYDQLASAARTVCLEDNANGVMAEHRVRVCTADTLGRAVAELDAPEVASLHAERTGLRQPAIPRLYAERN